MFYFDKMVGMYAIVGDSEVEEADLSEVYGNSPYRKFFVDADMMLDTLLPLSPIDIRDRMHQWYCFRMDLRELFHQKLFESKGYAAISFVMRATMHDFLNLIKTSKSVFSIATAEPEHSLAVAGRSKKLFYAEKILSQSTVRDVFHFVIMDTDALIPVLGDLWYCRVLVPHNQYQGDHLLSKYACVPHTNSNVAFAFDVNSNQLFVTVPVVCLYSHDTSVNGMQSFVSQLEMFRRELSGADVYDLELDEYFHVCFVEYNTTDFTEKKRRRRLYGCNIAWLLSYHDFEIREDPNLIVACSDPENVEERKRYAIPFSVEDVMEMVPIDMKEVKMDSLFIRRICDRKARRLVDFKDESGLDVEKFCFRKKDRSVLSPMDASDDPDNVRVKNKLLADFAGTAVVEGGLYGYLVRELLNEARESVSDVAMRFVTACRHSCYKLNDIADLIERPPFNIDWTQEELTELGYFYRGHDKVGYVKLFTSIWMKKYGV